MIRFNASFDTKLEACFRLPLRAVALSACLAVASAGEVHSVYPYAP